MSRADGADPILRLYAFALCLYPRSFQAAFASSMLQTLRDALDDGSLNRPSLWLLVLRDLVISRAKEHLAMLLNVFGRPALVFNALVLSALASCLALALHVIPQQVLRQGANDPQIALAGDLVAKLENGAAPAQAVPQASVDVARSLSPFVIVYDGQGKPIASEALLAGQTPALPQGVFDYVREHGEERISWQPGPGRAVRIAAVIQRVSNASGPGAAFVLAGRNMREIEAREAQVSQLATLTWLGMMAVILIGTAAFGWYTRPKAA